MSFESLQKALEGLRVSKAPESEKELEGIAERYLAWRGFKVVRQPTSRLGRNDLVVESEGRFCIELKNHATKSCIDQLDRYARDFQGLILLCYSATDGIRYVMEKGKESAKIPLALVEVRNNLELA